MHGGKTGGKSGGKSGAKSKRAAISGKKTSSSSKAGITMPVGRIARLLKAGRYSDRIGRGAPVFLASVLEYLTAELVELAGAAAKDADKKRITPRYINLAIRGDDEFGTLLHGAIISGGGVMPHINKVLVKGKKSKSSSSSSGKKDKKEKKSKSKSKSKSKKEKKSKDKSPSKKETLATQDA